LADRFARASRPARRRSSLIPNLLERNPVELLGTAGWIKKARFKKTPDGLDVAEFTRELSTDRTSTATGTLKKVK